MKSIFARELSVLVYTDTDKDTNSGTGALFCPPGDEYVYVLTCAHVLEGSKDIHVHFLIPANRDTDDFDEASVTMSKDEAIIHPNYIDPTGKNDTAYDAAILRFKRPEGLTNAVIRFGNPLRKMFVCGFGYPKQYRNIQLLASEQDEIEAEITFSPSAKNTFSIRLNKPIINLADRIPEIEGFSGPPLCDAETEEVIVYGTVTAACGQNADRNVIYGIQSKVFHSLLQSYKYPVPEMLLPFSEVVRDGFDS